MNSEEAYTCIVGSKASPLLGPQRSAIYPPTFTVPSTGRTIDGINGLHQLLLLQADFELL